MIKFDHQNLMIKFWPSNFEDQMLTIQVWSSNFDHHNLLIKFWPSKFEHQTLTITIWLAWPSFSSSCQSERGGWHWLIKFWWSKCDWPSFWHLTSVFDGQNVTIECWWSKLDAGLGPWMLCVSSPYSQLVDRGGMHCQQSREPVNQNLIVNSRRRNMKDQTLQAASGCKLDGMTSTGIISNFLLGHLVSASNDSPKSGSHTHTHRHTHSLIWGHNNEVVLAQTDETNLTAAPCNLRMLTTTISAHTHTP